MCESVPSVVVVQTISLYILHTLDIMRVIVQELCENRGGRPNEASGFRGRKAIPNHAHALVSACP